MSDEPAQTSDSGSNNARGPPSVDSSADGTWQPAQPQPDTYTKSCADHVIAIKSAASKQLGLDQLGCDRVLQDSPEPCPHVQVDIT